MEEEKKPKRRQYNKKKKKDGVDLKKITESDLESFGEKNDFDYDDPFIVDDRPKKKRVD